jgi:carotenoid 1,2-hydratase
MTERGRGSVARSDSMLRIGPSSLCWQGGTLKIDVDEIGAPLPKRIRGTIRVTPSGFSGRSFALDAGGNHIWQPIAPRTQIDVQLDRPDLHWRGTGYLDSNFGAEPLEARFSRWSWSRAHLAEDSVVLYDARRRDGTDAAMALRFSPDGGVQAMPPPPRADLPRTGWRVVRETRNDPGHAVRLRKTLEDTPFYARSLIETQLYGERGEAFHESLVLDRFASPVVRAMLPFRMPRRIF